jgi:hypothetical protein
MAENYLKILAPEARPTPRNLLAGYIADALKAANEFAQKPDNTMPMGKANPMLSLLAEFASLPSLATTADRISYGEPLTNINKANVPLLKPETADALMMAPLNPRAAVGLASAGLGMADNGAAHAGLFNVDGLVDRGRGVIQSKADELAGSLRANGFEVTVEHGGSMAGPSSYLRVFDPQTGRFFTKQVRLSGHSKGQRELGGVWDVNESDFPAVLQGAQDMRALGPGAMMKAELERNGKKRP